MISSRVMIAVVSALGLALPASAGAATATLWLYPPQGPGPLTYQAANGEANQLYVSALPHETYRFVDEGATIAAFGDGCESITANEVRCMGVPLRTYLGNRDDFAQVFVSGQADVWGGPGNDELVADSTGARTRLYGEQGDDNVWAGGEGGQVADGGPGDDTVRCCGFAGGGTLRGGPGDDRLIFDQGSIPGPGVLEGGTGDDTIVSHYTSSVDAGSGDDAIDVANGWIDTVSCGSGRDTVVADAGDLVAGDCEVVQIAP